MKYKYLFIDWYKTLSLSVFWEQFKADSHPYHYLYKPIQNVLFIESPDLVNRWMRGYSTCEAVVIQICQRLDFDPKILIKELIISCQQMRLMSDSSLSLVAELREMGIKVIIATDNMDTFHRWTAPSLGLARHFDHILSSFELNALKTDTDLEGRSSFFAPYLKSNAIHSGEALLLDDSNFGQIMQRTGLDYEQVEPGTLDASLHRILAFHKQNK